MVYKLIYSSTQNFEYTPETIESIINTATKFNNQKGITGILLYIEGSIIQLIEGDKEAVNDLFENKICKDTRHKDIRLLMKGNAQERNFPDWYMGFKIVNYQDYSSYLKYNNYLHDISPHLLFQQNDPLKLLFDIINYNSYNIHLN